MVCGREDPGVEVKVRRMSSNHVNAHALNTTIIIIASTRDTGTQVRSPKCETFLFVLPKGIYIFTQENESRA